MKQESIISECSAKIILNNKTKIIFAFFLSFLCLLLLSELLNTSMSSFKKVNKLKRTIGEDSYYSMHENISDQFYYYYCSSDNYKYKELAEFAADLYSNKEYIYVSACLQPIEIINGINNKPVSEEFIYGYESGDWKDNIYCSGSTKRYFTKSCQISYSMLKKYNMQIMSGRSFSKHDYSYNSAYIPVILGYDYYEKGYHSGDTFEADYLYSKKSFRIVGFFDKDTYYTNGNEIVYLDRYIVFPQTLPDPYSPNAYNKNRLIQMFNGSIVTENTFSSAEKYLSETVKQYNLPYGRNGLFITDNSTADTEITSVMQMSSEILHQYVVLITIFIIFCILTLSITINGIVRSSNYLYKTADT